MPVESKQNNSFLRAERDRPQPPLARVPRDGAAAPPPPRNLLRTPRPLLRHPLHEHWGQRRHSALAPRTQGARPEVMLDLFFYFKVMRSKHFLNLNNWRTLARSERLRGAFILIVVEIVCFQSREQENKQSSCLYVSGNSPRLSKR